MFVSVRWGGGFESNRIRNWDLLETSVHSPDENYSVGRFRSNDTLETTWLHATVGRIDRDTRTVLETRRKRKRSRVLGKWFARACRARDIEDRSLRASSSRCETRLVRSLSHPTIQSIFPLFKRIVPAFIFLKVRFKTERRRLLVTRERLRKRLFFWCDLLSFSRKICESRVLFVEKCTKGSLIHGTDNGWVEVYEANRLTFRS